MSWIDDLLLKAGISQEVGPPKSIDALGNPYVTLVIGGVKPEGEKFPLFATSKQAAKDYYIRYLLEFLQGNTHIIWRVEPEIEEYPIPINRARGEEGSLWAVYSRLTAYPIRSLS